MLPFKLPTNTTSISRETSEQQEHIPFLPQKEEVAFIETRSKNTSLLWKTSLSFHLVLISLYTAISITVILSFHTPVSEKNPNALPSLSSKQIRLQYPLMQESLFVGSPSPEVDAAWHNLLSNMSIRVTASELAQQSLTSVSLPRGGQLAWLGVFHELHCIKILRQANYRDYYHPEAAGQVLRDLQLHADHCIELSRATAMCRPDLKSLTTFVWRTELENPLLSPDRPVRKCLDWDALMDSIHERVVSDEEIHAMNNPID
ncbi:hypothetical protein G7Y89_g4255 [Cudoniella acicularis]|uniref:Uncharacterized protein n=1 Tax=Cudoniella acicularis TaxID=354080 RepID=A0A8H4RQM2_9HELO|nr:hypothetical protein G7Y89_g4255 [Cudoniella acicularis]